MQIYQRKRITSGVVSLLIFDWHTFSISENDFIGIRIDGSISSINEMLAINIKHGYISREDTTHFVVESFTLNTNFTEIN